MTIVTIRSCRTYEKKNVINILEEAMSDIGGIEKIIRRGDKVLIKPNMLGAKSPESAVTTHPSIVEAVAKMVIDCGGKPFIADSPGIDPFNLVKAKTGIGAVGERLNIPVIPLTDSLEIPQSSDRYFKKLELSKLAVECDKLINLPKLKTHCQMTLTMGVKNLFGTVVAQRKAEWHYKVGLNRDLFARLLLDIWSFLAPDITIMDGVIGMEGHGPSNGVPVKTGIIAASDNSLAMDLTLAKMVGVPLRDFPLYRAARSADLLPDHIIYRGNVDRNRKYRLDIPKQDSLRLLPGFLDKIGRDFLTSKPEHISNRCISCRKCIDICPADAIEMIKDRTVKFDYNKCIRCYCCHEMCPVNAIRLKKGLILRLLDIVHR